MPAGKTKIEPEHFNGANSQLGKKAHKQWDSGRPRDDVLIRSGGNPPDRKPVPPGKGEA